MYIKEKILHVPSLTAAHAHWQLYLQLLMSDFLLNLEPTSMLLVLLCWCTSLQIDTLLTKACVLLRSSYTLTCTPCCYNQTHNFKLLIPFAAHICVALCTSPRCCPSWFVLLGGSRPSVHQVVYVSVWAKCAKLSNICLAISLYSPHSSFSFSNLFLFPFLSVWQGSTESCNNPEEEEMKGRKGTCPTFTYSACLFCPLYVLFKFCHCV